MGRCGPPVRGWNGGGGGGCAKERRVGCVYGWNESRSHVVCVCVCGGSTTGRCGEGPNLSLSLSLSPSPSLPLSLSLSLPLSPSLSRCGEGRMEKARGSEGGGAVDSELPTYRTPPSHPHLRVTHSSESPTPQSHPLLRVSPTLPSHPLL